MTKATEAVLVAQINARVGPMDRYEIFEDPLTEALDEKGEVTGGGTMLGEDGEVAYCDVEICLPEVTEGLVELLVSLLEEMGAPKGSKLLDGEQEVRQFGKNEGLAVYLNGFDLPAETYSSCDVNFVEEEFGRLVGEDGRVMGCWEGPRETAFYLYGPSFETMRSKLVDFLASYPLCERCRVVQIV